MTDVWFYIILAVIAFEVLIHFLRERLEKREELFLKDKKLFLLTPDTGMLFLVPLGGFFLAYFLTAFFHFKSGMFEFLTVVLIAGILVFVFASQEFLWLHFFEDKIIVRYPLRSKTVEIFLAKMTKVGYKYFILGKGHHYFIEFENGKKPKYIPFTGVGVERTQLLEYFSSRNIEFHNIEV
jgi:hypothetical protein